MGPSFTPVRVPTSVAIVDTLPRAVALAAAAEGFLTLMDACIKTLTARYPTFQIAFLRFGMGTLWAAAFFVWSGPQWPTRAALKYNATRSVLAVVAAVSFFYALSKLPMAEAMALSFLSPLFIALFGALLLKERLDARIGLALIAGIAGMLVIVGGQIGAKAYGNDALLGAGAVVVSAVFFALVIIILRARANHDPLPVIVLFQNAGPALLLLAPGVYVWRPIVGYDLAVYFLIGALGVVGHSLLAMAFARAEAARLAPVHYVVLVWGSLFGYFFFGDVPGLSTLVGASLIVAATLLSQRARA